MSHGITTSIRLTTELREQLEKAAHTLHRGKNWIIVKALEEYLAKVNRDKWAKEAKRQSILASKIKTEEEKAWERDMEEDEWK
jgi:predicted transcriptional regulator